jgi:hypothetical protein
MRTYISRTYISLGTERADLSQRSLDLAFWPGPYYDSCWRSED